MGSTQLDWAVALICSLFVSLGRRKNWRGLDGTNW